MHKIFNYTKLALLITMIAASISCKKSFLEVLPKGKVIATKTSDYNLLLNNLSLVNTGSLVLPLLGDEVVALEPTWSTQVFRIKQAFKWEGDLYNVSENGIETLEPVKGIYIYNKVINEVLESTEGSERTKKSLQAEALAGRAWTNFFLINLYGKPYTAATAATDPGFPLMLEADINAQDFRRASVQQIYDQIIADLTTAIPNLENEGVFHRIRMSKAAAQAILGKVYVFMGRYEDALPLLNESISNLSKSSLAANIVNYNTAWPGFPTVVNDVENAYVKNMNNSYISGSNRLLWLTPEVSALFKSTDTRVIRMQSTTTFANGLTLYKRLNTTTNNIGIKIPELYLLRAEVKGRLDDLQGAKADVEFLRQHRMPAADVPVPANIAASKLPLLNFIIEERIREFAVQGYRWFDMRRLSVDPLFTLPNAPHRVYNANGEVSETYTLKPERLTLKFAPKILVENPNMEDNP